MITGDQTDTLSAALAEQLKTPLLQIARLSEFPEAASSAQIAVISQHALRLVDAYTQTQAQAQTKLLLQPVNTGAVLYDVANSLRSFAKQWNYEVDIDLLGKNVPIMAHRDSLMTMLTLLGASLIEASIEDDSQRRLILGTHRTSQGTVVGAFNSSIVLSQRALQLVRELHGKAAQVVPSLGMAGGASLAIADQLSNQLFAPLRAYRHNSLWGVGSMLLPSRQLELLEPAAE